MPRRDERRLFRLLRPRPHHPRRVREATCSSASQGAGVHTGQFRDPLVSSIAAKFPVESVEQASDLRVEYFVHEGPTSARERGGSTVVRSRTLATSAVPGLRVTSSERRTVRRGLNDMAAKESVVEDLASRSRSAPPLGPGERRAKFGSKRDLSAPERSAERVASCT
jgi:hypothetical protein